MAAAEESRSIRPLLILVEDESGLRRSLQLLLQGQGFEVRAFSTAEHVLADTSVDDAQLLVADYRLPADDGIALLRRLRARGWRGRSILITGFPAEELDAEAIAAGYSAVLEKPLPPHRLATAIAHASATGSSAASSQDGRSEPAPDEPD